MRRKEDEEGEKKGRAREREKTADDGIPDCSRNISSCPSKKKKRKKRRTNENNREEEEKCVERRGRVTSAGSLPSTWKVKKKDIMSSESSIQSHRIPIDVHQKTTTNELYEYWLLFPCWSLCAPNRWAETIQSLEVLCKWNVECVRKNQAEINENRQTMS